MGSIYRNLSEAVKYPHPAPGPFQEDIATKTFQGQGLNLLGEGHEPILGTSLSITTPDLPLHIS